MAFCLNFRRNSARRHKGSSLIEVMVAVVVLSFGLLALAGLTASSLKYTKISQFQLIGAQLASDYADRMRSNITAFQAGNYARTAAYSESVQKVTVPLCANADACTPAEISAIDQAEWTNALRQRLPGGNGYVVRDTINTLAADIWVMWREPNMKFDGSDLSAAVSGDCPAAAVGGLPAGTLPRCMYFRVSL